MITVCFQCRKSTKLLILLTIIVIWYLIYNLTNTNSTRPTIQKNRHPKSRKTPKQYRFNGTKIVHLDLKGAPPKPAYYEYFFPLLAKMGANGVLIEYEDMFPYSTPSLTNVSALNAYTFADIDKINRLAAENNLQVIPLVQTFGHLEFLLKLPEYRHLREVAEFPQVVCPRHEQTVGLLMEMIDQMVAKHPRSRFIHIGADEVYYLGYCERCSSAMSEFNISKNMLFLSHVNAISRRIAEKHPKLKILMWDDEFRSFSRNELKDLHKNVIPVVWSYVKDVNEFLGPSLWQMYAKTFSKVWAASAFKGATGSDQYVNDVTHYVQNHRSWHALLAEYSPRIEFEGIIITGWQRYDHFAILCELLPVSLPALAMSLRVLDGRNDSPLGPPLEVAQLLGCAQPYALMGPVFGSPRCAYPGGEVLEAVLRLAQLKQEFEALFDESTVRGWLNGYNRRHLFSNPRYVQVGTASLGRIRGELEQVKAEAVAALSEVYDRFTVEEWMETHVREFDRSVDELIKVRDEILEKETWPRRPLGDEL